MTRAWCSQILIAAVATLASLPSATASTVVLVRPENPTATTAEAIVRMHGELVSGGFDVEVASAGATTNAIDVLEKAASVPGVDAVIAILGGSLPDSIELWVVDRVTGKTLVRRLPHLVDFERTAESLAIRALELLRASLLEVAIATGNASRRPPPLAVTHMVEETLDARASATWCVETGGNLLAAPSGALLTLEPMLRVSRLFGSLWMARASIAGLGTSGRTDTSYGTAFVDQSYALIETGVQLRPRTHIQPVLALGAGALRVTAEGRAAWPYQGQTSQRWAFLASASAGVHIWIAHRFGFAAEAQAQFAQPYPSVRFFGAEVSQVGRPSLLLTLSLLAWL